MRLLSSDGLLRCGMTPGTHALLALSGGADSVALLLLLSERLACGELGALSAAHFNHGLRGEAADADERFCRALCETYAVPFHAERGDVRAYAEENGLGLEEAARTLRYAFLRRTAKRLSADCIATAHHADDQAETVLLHLLRGSGMTGLCGMQPRAGDLARPLLTVSHAQLLAYLAARGQTYCTDATNGDAAFLRNRVRRELLPALRGYNPQIVQGLCSTAALLSEDERYLVSLGEAALFEAARDGGYDRIALSGQSAPVRKRALLRLLRETLEYDVRRADVERVDALLTAQAGTRIELRQGNCAYLDGDVLRLGPEPEEPVFFSEIEPDGVCRVGGWRIRCRRTASYRAPGSPMEACLALDAADQPLTVRSRRPGDRFRPLGSGGSRLLSDVFTDRKTPRRLRRVPLLCGGDEILFVPGYTVAERARVTPQSRDIIQITVEEDVEA